MEVALELAEELLRLEPGSALHARRRDRLRQRLARPMARRMGNGEKREAKGNRGAKGNLSMMI